jgi:hypothetical protein
LGRWLTELYGRSVCLDISLRIALQNEISCVTRSAGSLSFMRKAKDELPMIPVYDLTLVFAGRDQL